MLTLKKSVEKAGYHGHDELIKYQLGCEMDAFIIPNFAATTDEFSDPETEIRYQTEVCKLNGLDEFDPEKDKLIQLWFTSTDLGSDNVTADGFHIDVASQKLWGRIPQFLPAKLLRKWKEGEVVDVKLPLYVYTSEYFYEEWRRDENDRYYDVYFNCTFNAEITPAQLRYRYRTFGKFEDLVESVAPQK